MMITKTCDREQGNEINTFCEGQNFCYDVDLS